MLKWVSIARFFRFPFRFELRSCLEVERSVGVPQAEPRRLLKKSCGNNFQPIDYCVPIKWFDGLIRVNCCLDTMATDATENPQQFKEVIA
jgi:hypothetical protein